MTPQAGQSALIGHTGFVGTNLLRSVPFDATFNSSNIADIRGRSFGRIVCAGVTAVKWWANQNAEDDLSRIRSLMDHLETVDANLFTLISTVDVYHVPREVDEGDQPDLAWLEPYGRHRAMLEAFVKDRFKAHRIVRLPALFGEGLKKNAIFDLMTDNRLDFINPSSSFQWYPLGHLAADLDRIEACGFETINLATEPVTMQDVQRSFFPGKTLSGKQPAISYDMRTRHASVFRGQGDYMLSRDEVLQAMSSFLGGTVQVR